MSQMNWAPLVGVVVGFLLGQVATVVRGFISERRERNLVRLLVSLEIDQNLALLGDYWHNVSLPPDEDEPEDDEAPLAKKAREVESDRLSRRAIEIPLPLLSEKGFNNLLQNEFGLVSAYHGYYHVEHGQEIHNTYFDRTKKGKPFHIDYCFIPRLWLPSLNKVTVGQYEEWRHLSDHMPLMIEVNK